MLKLLDGNGEAAGLKTAKEARSSHTPIMMRNPREFYQAEKDKVPMVLNLDNVGVKDLEYIRKVIKEREGQVDTEFMFDHPEADMKGGTEKQVTIDVLGVMAFFFPKVMFDSMLILQAFHNFKTSARLYPSVILINSISSPRLY